MEMQSVNATAATIQTLRSGTIRSIAGTTVVGSVDVPHALRGGQVRTVAVITDSGEFQCRIKSGDNQYIECLLLSRRGIAGFYTPAIAERCHGQGPGPELVISALKSFDPKNDWIMAILKDSSRDADRPIEPHLLLGSSRLGDGNTMYDKILHYATVSGGQCPIWCIQLPNAEHEEEPISSGPLAVESAVIIEPHAVRHAMRHNKIRTLHIIEGGRRRQIEAIGNGGYFTELYLCFPPSRPPRILTPAIKRRCPCSEDERDVRIDLPGLLIVTPPDVEPNRFWGVAIAEDPNSSDPGWTISRTLGSQQWDDLAMLSRADLAMLRRANDLNQDRTGDNTYQHIVLPGREFEQFTP